MIRKSDIKVIDAFSLSEEESIKIKEMTLAAAFSFGEKYGAKIREKMKQNLGGFASEIVVSNFLKNRFPEHYQKSAHEDFDFKSLPFYEDLKDISYEDALNMRDKELSDLHKKIYAKTLHKTDIDIMFGGLKVDVKNTILIKDKKIFTDNGKASLLNFQVYKDRADRNKMDIYIQTFTYEGDNNVYITGFMQSEQLTNKAQQVFGKNGIIETYREPVHSAYRIDEMDMVFSEKQEDVFAFEDSPHFANLEAAIHFKWENMNFLNKLTLQEQTYLVTSDKYLKLSHEDMTYIYEKVPSVVKDVIFLPKEIKKDIHKRAFELNEKDLKHLITKKDNQETQKR